MGISVYANDSRLHKIATSTLSQLRNISHYWVCLGVLVLLRCAMVHPPTSAAAAAAAAAPDETKQHTIMLLA